MADQDPTREAAGPPDGQPSPPHRDKPHPSSPDAQKPVDAESTRDYVARPNLGRDSRPDAFPGYELLEILGAGGMGVVYKARQEGLKRLVALKVILGGRRAGPKELIRFLAEAEAVASIRHPNVVQVFEYGEADGRPFLAMEYLSGGSLSDRLKGEGRLAPKVAAELVGKLARAVQTAHDQGIVHRDLKPANVLFDDQDEPKVTDFGLAKRAKGSDLTLTEAVMGTPAYMSPEQAQGKSKFVGPPADIYALGVILYQCLTGRRPFQDADAHLLLRQVIEDEPERPSKLVPGLPLDLELIALKCLAKDPIDRYPTALALAVDLAHFVAGEPVSVRPTGLAERAMKWARRKPVLAAAYALTAAVAVLFAFGATVAVLWWQAEGARAIAEQSKSDLEIANEKFGAKDYGDKTQEALQNWKDQKIGDAVTSLNKGEVKYRGWEWRYVQRLCSLGSRDLKGSADNPNLVNAASWSPDGSRIVTAHRYGKAYVWDARSGAQLLTLKGEFMGDLTSVSWSPDGSRIAVGNEARRVRVWDARTGSLIVALDRYFSKATSASFSSDGSRIATFDGDTVLVWDARTGSVIVVLTGHTDLVTSASWSPDGKRIVTASRDGTAKVCDDGSIAGTLTLKGHTKLVSSASWSPDGSWIATGSDDGTARVWDARSGAQIVALDCTNRLTSVSWSPDGSRIATASRDDSAAVGDARNRTARVWDANTGARILAVESPTDEVSSVSWSPDGSRIATSGQNKMARVWDAKTGAEIITLTELTSPLTSLSWSPDSTSIATTCEDGSFRVWDARGASEALALKGHTGPVTSISWRSFRVWDARSDSEVLTLKGHTDPVTSVSWSPDGSRIATGGGDKTARVWDAKTGAQIVALPGHTGLVNAVSWSPDGSRIVTASQDGSARVWDARTGVEDFALRRHAGFQYSSSGMDYRPKDTPKVPLDLQERKEQWTEPLPITSVSWSPDGSRIACGSWSTTARVWEPRVGSVTITLKEHLGPTGFHTDRVNSVAWSPDGSRVATASRDKTARVWDAKTGDEAITLEGHTGEVLSVSWSPDGSRVATASQDGSAWLWYARTGARLLALKGHTGSVTSVSWSSDGSRIATTGQDNMAQIWDAGPPG